MVIFREQKKFSACFIRKGVSEKNKNVTASTTAMPQGWDSLWTLAEAPTVLAHGLYGQGSDRGAFWCTWPHIGVFLDLAKFW